MLKKFFAAGFLIFAAAGCAPDRGEEAINESLYQAALEAGLKATTRLRRGTLASSGSGCPTTGLPCWDWLGTCVIWDPPGMPSAFSR